MELLIFYYIFSVFFMIGYVDFRDLDGVGPIILGIIAILILSPICLPMNLGDAIKNLKDL